MRFFAKSALILFFIFSLTITFSQTKKQSNSSDKNKIVAEFAGEKIYKDEFENAFLKAGSQLKANSTDSAAEKNKFLELFVNYKMKLKDALQRKLDKEPDVIQEYQDYRKSIASTIFVDKEVISKGVKLIYDRRKLEIRFSHIFVKFDSSKSDLGMARAQEAFDKIKAGQKFEDVLMKYTDDPASKLNNGDLYYITFGDINIPEIENSLYETPVGEICPQIFKTPTGFHILKVTERRERPYGVNVSHILTLKQIDNNEPDSVAAKKKIDDAIKELNSGVQFAEVAKKYSDDKVTKEKGGFIGTIKRGDFPRALEEIIMNMKENETSGIITTPYGFHIIKVGKINPYPPFEEQKEQLKQMYQQTGYQRDLQNFIVDLKNKMGYKLNTILYNKLIAIKDSMNVGDSLFEAKVVNKFKDSLLVALNKKNYLADSVFVFMTGSPELQSRRYDKNTLDEAVDKYFSDIVISESALAQLSNDSEFEKIMSDYMMGILLFKVSDIEIWSKIKIDSNQIKSYWEQTKDKYYTKPTVTYKEIFLATPELRDSVFKALNDGAKFDDLLKKSAKSTANNSHTKEPEKDKLAAIANKIAKIGDYSDPIEYTGGWSIARLEGKNPPRMKTYEEARQEISSLLQENESKRVEGIYINKLKEKFKPKLYPENILN